MAVVKDWRGTEIKVGSTVVYPSRQGSSLWMNEATVVSIEETGKNWRDETQYKVGVKRTNTTWFGDGASDRVSYPDWKRITVVA